MKKSKKSVAAPSIATQPVLDLHVIVADLDAENLMKSLLKRHQSLKTKPFSFEINTYATHDSGCRSDIAYLPYLRHAQYLLVMFDKHGCGDESHSAEQIETDCEQRSQKQNLKVIVIDPELEQWLWVEGNPHVAEALGWDSYEALKAFLGPKTLTQKKHSNVILRGDRIWPAGNSKPDDPKEALSIARKKKTQESSTLFEQLGSKVSFTGCNDRAFLKLLATLQGWFPAF